MRLATQFGAVVLTGALVASAQGTAPAASTSWVKDYARCRGQQNPCPAGARGDANLLSGDPRFKRLMTSSFRQTQSWWGTNRRPSGAVSQMIDDFLGVGGDVFLDDDRYLTTSGCIPHACMDGGMLWIDTGTEPALLIFVAMDDVAGGDFTHLWIYASRPVDFGNLPPEFLKALDRWWQPYKQHKQLPVNVALATLVQPNGFSKDLTWNTLFFHDNLPGKHRMGTQK